MSRGCRASPDPLPSDDAATAASVISTAAGDLELDQRADRTIEAIYLRLQARGLLDDGEPAERAADHLALLYPDDLKAFKKVATAYSAMVKAMGRVVVTTVDQREVLVEMQATIVQHASRILGKPRDADPKSVARTRARLAPIENFRARTSTSTPRTAGPVAPPATPPLTSAIEDAVEARAAPLTPNRTSMSDFGATNVH